MVEGQPISGTTGQVNGRLNDMEWAPPDLN